MVPKTTSVKTERHVWAVLPLNIYCSTVGRCNHSQPASTAGPPYYTTLPTYPTTLASDTVTSPTIQNPTLGFSEFSWVCEVYSLGGDHRRELQLCCTDTLPRISRITPLGSGAVEHFVGPALGPGVGDACRVQEDAGCVGERARQSWFGALQYLVVR
ncbi:hypothetical protein BDW02DRAFT_405452 [Decorospora gaudefroyi]|uniref:Uncharacterized protein n=1 Tax=Decorospora gaudefroyi TaxID=184978 RepID=A0A6A5KD29_9PLEO|nr:hypothetical protein BDW02DRAFT_405452 [Decorospora gaudefroyi]